MENEKVTRKIAGRLRVSNGKCPEGHSLMDAGRLMDGEPAIAVRIRNQGKEGMLYLNPFYGRFEYDSEIPLNLGDVLEIFCPHCGVSLLIDERCCLCDVAMFAVHLPDGGEVEACPTVGCQKHSLKIVDLDAQLERMYVEDIKFQM